LALLPQIPERTRWARLFKTPTAWTTRFLAAPTVLGGVDSYGIALIHPMREGRSPAQIGKQGQSNPRWIVGGNLCFILNQWGVICAWDGATVSWPDDCPDRYRSPCEEGDPANMKVCPCGTWKTRMVVETVWSMLTTVLHSKKVGYRVWVYFRARIAEMLAAFNLSARGSLEIDDENMVRLSIAEFSL
jgi:hypothetical protein